MFSRRGGLIPQPCRGHRGSGSFRSRFLLPFQSVGGGGCWRTHMLMARVPRGPLPSTRLPDLSFRVNVGKDSLRENSAPWSQLNSPLDSKTSLKKSAAERRPWLRGKGSVGHARAE